MKWPLEVGTVVRISERGHRVFRTGGSNPAKTLGTVMGSHHGERWVRVKWDNGTTNSYTHGTLDIIQPVQLEND